MLECQYEDIKVMYYEPDDDIGEIFGEADFIVARTDPDNIERRLTLEKRGFHFHNRTILGEINLIPQDEKLLRMVRGDMRMDNLYIDEMLALAMKSFVKDRRFHLAKEWNQNLADKILKGYLDRFSKENTMLFKCFHNGNLAGFTIVKELDQNSCENVLGAVDPLYQSRGVAVGLYAYMLRELKEKGYKKLCGRISTTNVASINLHIALGAKYSRPEDEYVKEGI